MMTDEMHTGVSAQNTLGRAVWIAIGNLWQGRPEEAWTALYPAIDEEVVSPRVADCWLPFVTLARAAADRSADGRNGSASLKAILLDLRERAVTDPLGPGRAPIVRRAATAQWDAELARIERLDKVEQWSRAAAEWTALHSPHFGAYCRWRAAQAALRDGQGTVATRMLERAAADAREHIPLSNAIAETAAAR